MTPRCGCSSRWGGPAGRSSDLRRSIGDAARARVVRAFDRRPQVEAYEDRIEKAEDALLGPGSVEMQTSLAATFQIKRDLLTFRRAVAPLRDVLGRVVHVDKSVLGEDLDVEFRDLYDHVLRVYDELDTQRQPLATGPGRQGHARRPG